MDARTWIFVICVVLIVIVLAAAALYFAAASGSRLEERLKGTKHDPEVIASESKKTPPNPPNPPPTSLE